MKKVLNNGVDADCIHQIRQGDEDSPLQRVTEIGNPVDPTQYVQKRNAQIVRFWKTGTPLNEIAERFFGKEMVGALGEPLPRYDHYLRLTREIISNALKPEGLGLDDEAKGDESRTDGKTEEAQLNTRACGSPEERECKPPRKARKRKPK